MSLFLLSHCLLLPSFGVGLVLFSCFVLRLFVSLTNHLAEKEKTDCFVTVCLLCLFISMPWVDMQSKIEAFPGVYTKIFLMILSRNLIC